MPYVISYQPLWLLTALAFGLIAGLVTYREDRPNLMDGTVWAVVIAWLIGCVIALAKLLPGRAGLMLELGLSLSLAYGAGCFIGWAVLRWKSETRPNVALAGASLPASIGEEPAMLSTVNAWIKGALGSDPPAATPAPAKPEPSESPAVVVPEIAAPPPVAHPVKLGEALPPHTTLNVTREGMPSMMRDRFTRVFNATVVPDSDPSAPSAPQAPAKPAAVIPMRSTMFAAAKSAQPLQSAPVVPQPSLPPKPEPPVMNGATLPEASHSAESNSLTEIASAFSLFRQRLHLPDLTSIKSRLEAERTRLTAITSRSNPPPPISPARDQLDRPMSERSDPEQ